LLQGERDSVPDVSGRLRYARVRDFVCPDCDEAYRAWWAAWEAEHASRTAQRSAPSGTGAQ
jgi:hypothetical protein